MPAPAGNQHNKLPPGMAAYARIHIKARESEKAEWQAMAESQGLSLSVWIKNLCRKEKIKELDE